MRTESFLEVRVVQRKLSLVDPALAGLIGVFLGAAVSVLGTWWVSTLLERRRDNRRLSGVLGLLASELKDNEERPRHNPGATRDDWDNLLTLGNWDANKAAFSQLMRDPELWERVTTMYKDIFEAISGRQDPPTVDALGDVYRRLLASREQLTR